MTDYPNTEGRSYSATSWEIRLGRNIYTAIGNLAHNQPLEEEWVYAGGQPILRSDGVLQAGEGTIEFSDIGEMQRFIDDLGDGWMDKTFTVLETLTARNRPTLVYTLGSCRLLDAELDVDGQAPDPIGSSHPFSFMERLMNGKKARGVGLGT
jgi:hypothetical protein